MLQTAAGEEAAKHVHFSGFKPAAHIAPLPPRIQSKSSAFSAIDRSEPAALESRFAHAGEASGREAIARRLSGSWSIETPLPRPGPPRRACGALRRSGQALPSLRAHPSLRREGIADLTPPTPECRETEVRRRVRLSLWPAERL